MSDEIRIAGYPRSGNTWTGILLSDLLSSPWYSGGQPRWFGNMGGKYSLFKSHTFPNEITKTRKVIFIYRDPRAVCVSMFFYRRYKDLYKAITDVANVYDPGRDLYGPYDDFIDAWLDYNASPIIPVRYCDLNKNTAKELRRIADWLGEDIPDDYIKGVVSRHTFRGDLGQYGDNHFRRSGVVGSWRDYFGNKHYLMAKELFGQSMRRLGYE